MSGAVGALLLAKKLVSLRWFEEGSGSFFLPMAPVFRDPCPCGHWRCEGQGLEAAIFMDSNGLGPVSGTGAVKAEVP